VTATDLTFAPVDELVGLCAALDPPLGVSMDPAEVNPGRGGWLALDEIRTANLRGQLELRCSLFLISPDIDPKRALSLLAPMLNRLRTVLTPDGPVVPQGVVLPDSPTPMPALRVPVYLYTESE
jgi:hypothetical protein